MKRNWLYLGALFPIDLIDAKAAEFSGGAHPDDDLPRHRSKHPNDGSEDEQVEEQSDNANDGHKPHSARGHDVAENDAPPQDGYDDHGAGRSRGSSAALPSPDGHHDAADTQTPNGGMHAPIYGPSGVDDSIFLHNLGSGGAGGFVFLDHGQAHGPDNSAFLDDTWQDTTRHGSSQPFPPREGLELPDETGTTSPATPTGDPSSGSEPIGSEIAGTEPVGSERAGSEVAGAEPTGSEPAGAEPTGSEPAGSEPFGGEIANAEPSGGEADATDADSMIVMLGGTAASQGADGTTTGTIDLNIVDYGAVTIATGLATFESLSSGAGVDPGTANTFVDVIGADIVFTYDVDYDYALPFDQFVNFSQTYVLAIDFENDPGAAAAGAADAAGPFAQVTDLFAGLPPELLAMFDGEGSDAFSIDGNIADLTFSLVSDGDPGATTVAATTDSVEDTLSISDLDAQWNGGSIVANVDAEGVATIASIGGSVVEVENDYSTLSGWVIGAA